MWEMFAEPGLGEKRAHAGNWGMRVDWMFEGFFVRRF